jgi:hypothetical protein
VDEYVDQMVAKYIEPAKIVIQGKAQAGYRSIQDIGIVEVRIDREFGIFPCYFFEMQIRVLRDIGFVIKMPGTVEGIPVY